ncbi:MAG TPA: hypothetical protein VK034_24055 [Enhygromyxa sp.]|nr:hypothetical protein [Enhygromyxa sp.]
MMHRPEISEERRELLNFDAIRVGLNYVHGLEREQVCRSLREAGMVRHQALDGCECWHWPGFEPTEPCLHGYSFIEEKTS